MNKNEFSLNYHRLQLEVELSRRTGKSFQDLFEQIMQKADTSFLMVKPAGQAGDWKADGYSLNTATIYQCYAPEKMTAAKTANKIREDFDGAKARWQGKMRCWVFVWSSASALPPQAVETLKSLKDEHPDVVIEHIGQDGLWRIVEQLSLRDRESLFGITPDLSDAPRTTAAEIQVLMNHLASRASVTSDITNLDLTAIADKLRRNRLSAAVTNTVMPAMPVAKLVREFVTGMPDPAFSQVIAAELAREYTKLAATEDDPDVIFSNLVEYVQGEDRDLKLFWAAAGIITHYFELCDIFES